MDFAEEDDVDLDSVLDTALDFAAAILNVVATGEFVNGSTERCVIIL